MVFTLTFSTFPMLVGILVAVVVWCCNIFLISDTHSDSFFQCRRVLSNVNLRVKMPFSYFGASDAQNQATIKRITSALQMNHPRLSANLNLNLKSRITTINQSINHQCSESCRWCNDSHLKSITTISITQASTQLKLKLETVRTETQSPKQGIQKIFYLATSTLIHRPVILFSKHSTLDPF